MKKHTRTPKEISHYLTTKKNDAYLVYHQGFLFYMGKNGDHLDNYETHHRRPLSAEHWEKLQQKSGQSPKPLGPHMKFQADTIVEKLKSLQEHAFQNVSIHLGKKSRKPVVVKTNPKKRRPPYRQYIK